MGKIVSQDGGGGGEGWGRADPPARSRAPEPAKIPTESGSGNADERKRRQAENQKRWRAAHPGYMERWHEKNPGYAKRWYEGNRELVVKRSTQWRRDNPVKRLIQNARRRARQKGLPFCLTEEDLAKPDRCPILNIPLIYGSRRCNDDHSASLDRIVPEKGYTASNTWIISRRANTIKNNATAEELEKVAEALRFVGD